MSIVTKQQSKERETDHGKLTKKRFGRILTDVRQSVEDTLNALLNAEADAIRQASRYQRSPDRQDTRAESYKRKLLTQAGEVELHVPV